MSPSVGAVLVAKLEDLLHYLSDRRQWIELAALDLVQQPPQLGISFDRPLQMSLGAARGDCEHLAREVPPAAFLEAPVGLEVRPVLRDLLPQKLDVLAARRLGEDDRRAPRT